jgi:hypothetical protein
VVSFIDCIDRRDLSGLVDLMTDDHTLIVLDEEPLAGRDANRSPGTATSARTRTT